MSPWPQRNPGCLISDAWTYHAMRTIILENELLRIVVLVDRGSDIIEFRYKPLDLDYLYHMPGGMRNPAASMPSACSKDPFIDYYAGGWNEVLPNGGPYVIYQGAELGQHGEVSLLPWQYSLLEDTPERVTVKLWVRALRTPLFLEKTLTLESGKAVLSIEEHLTNEAGIPFPVMWGHHIAFGGDFLLEGGRIDTRAKQLIVHEFMPDYEPRRFRPGSVSRWPMALSPSGESIDASQIQAEGTLKAQEMAYITDLDEGWYAITNPVRKVGFAVRFDPRLYRYIWYWQQQGGAAQGFPWWGRTHTTALEPWTSFPTGGLNEAVSNGTALVIEPGQTVHTALKAIAYAGIEAVSSVTPEGVVEL